MNFIRHKASIIFSLFILFVSPLIALADEKINPEQDTIKVVMSAAFVSERGISVYSDMFRYLGDKLDIKVEFISGFSYETINQILDSGMADIGFICGLPYVIKKDKVNPSIELLLAPVMKNKKYQGKPVYYSYVIVNKKSKFKKFTDLKKSHFVYNDEISNSGYNMPRAHLIDLGETSGFFTKVSRSGSHEESIRMVARGEADASAVDSLVYDYDLLKNPEHVKNTRIIKVLGPAGIPPVVISVKTPGHIKNKIKSILMDMRNDPDGMKILDDALVDRFVEVSDANYNSIRVMKKKALDFGYPVIR